MLNAGFHLLGWIMPFAAIALGLVVIYLWIKRFRKPATAPVGVDQGALSRYHDQIEKDLAKLE